MRPRARAAAARPGQSDLRQATGLYLAALGVVFGDIGTSPLYALRECFHGPHAVAPSHANVLGVLSLIFWALMIVITVKYLAYVMRADNRGEGGILAMMALAMQGSTDKGWRLAVVTTLGLFGAALLYGDGMITPAISVLSAMEGLQVAAPALGPLVQPITIAILIGLFLVQHRGTAGVGAIFGPVTLIWFVVLGVMGVLWIVQAPAVLGAANPMHGVQFFIDNQGRGFLVLGAVFLVVTGGEALYADMGHFGVRPIRRTWFVIVLPALLAQYFGQGALLMLRPEAAENPFYHMVPAWGLYPMVVLAAMATIIASQAVISGAFSLTRQAIMLGFAPRTRVAHTSAREIGQIYVPFVNWMLMLATIGLVIGFGSSSNLAAAYGIAVTMTMVITTLLAYVVARRRWSWSLVAGGSVTLLLLVPDAAFFAANVTKITQGGWFPLVVGGLVFLVLTTWKRGRVLLGERIRQSIVPLDDFTARMASEGVVRVPGTSVFMTSNPEGTPPALLNLARHNHVVHEHVVLLSVRTEEQPFVAPTDRVKVAELGNGFVRMTARYGFMEDPDIPALLAAHPLPGYEPATTTFFLGRETVLAGGGMVRWRVHLFAFLARNAQRATAFFDLPPDRVMEIGSEVEI